MCPPLSSRVNMPAQHIILLHAAFVPKLVTHMCTMHLLSVVPVKCIETSIRPNACNYAICCTCLEYIDITHTYTHGALTFFGRAG